MMGSSAERVAPPAVTLVALDRRESIVGTLPPSRLTSFVGREREVATVSELIRRPDVRLVTLTGPGGVGKTRIALEVAAVVAEEGPDEVAIVALAPVQDPDLVLPSIAQTLGIRDAPNRPAFDQLRALLASRRFLLVLDNFEHLLPAAPLVARLLGSCPSLTVLVTSRGSLRVAGEREVPVAPMPLPDVPVGAGATTAGKHPAVRLFVDRAEAVRPGFALTDANARAIVDICRRLDGLPLAIELAAARTKVLPPPTLLSRLERRLTLLTTGWADNPERLRTMRNAIAWSHDLLTEEEQVLFRRLSVFVGGFDLTAADAVWATPPSLDGDPFDLTAALVDKSLVQRVEGGDRDGDVDAEPRFQMLETIREFAAERLAASGEDESNRAAHAAHVLALVERAETTFLRGEHAPWLDWLAPEQDNVRAALGWAIERRDSETALRLAGAVVWLWFVRGQFEEGRAWLDRALSPEWSRSHHTAARSKALFAAGMLAHYHGDRARVPVYLAECEALSRAVGDRSSLARSLLLRGVAAEDAGHYGEADPLLDEALGLFRNLGDRLFIAQTLVHLGIVAFGQGRYEEATARGAAALAAYDEVGDRLGAAVGVAGALDFLSLVATVGGDHARAIDLQRRALTMRRDLENPWGVVSSLEGLATVAARTGRFVEAARLFGVTEAQRAITGAPLAYPERAAYESAIALARAALGNDEYGAAASAGRALSIDEAVAEAVALEAKSSPSAAPDSPHGLTPREVQVLRLLTKGHSDKEIGEALFISHRTVMRHVSSVLAKLDVDSRVAAASWAIRQDLI